MVVKLTGGLEHKGRDILPTEPSLRFSMRMIA